MPTTITLRFKLMLRKVVSRSINRCSPTLTILVVSSVLDYAGKVLSIFVYAVCRCIWLLSYIMRCRVQLDVRSEFPGFLPKQLQLFQCVRLCIASARVTSTVSSREVIGSTHKIVKLDLAATTRDNHVDLLARLDDPPQRPKYAARRTPCPDLMLELVDAVLADLLTAPNHLLAIQLVHLNRQVRAVEVLPLGELRVGEMHERVRVGGVVVVCSPFVEMVGNVVPARIGRCVFEINDDVAVMRWTVPWWVIQLEQVAVLCVVI